MNKGYFIFIGQILAAMRGNKQFFISKNTSATHEIAAVFIELNIIKKVTEPTDRIIRRMPRTFRKNYQVFWLTSDRESETRKSYFDNTPLRSDTNRHKWFYNNIKIIKPRVFHQNIISYKELLNKKPFQNTIYIMQTTKGVITSQEALNRKLGGVIICIINLLKNKF